MFLILQEGRGGGEGGEQRENGEGQNWREEEEVEEGEVEVAVPSHKKLYPQPCFYKENEFCIKVHSKKRRKPNPK